MDQIKIGKFVQMLRKNKGMTQRELADKLDISAKTISKWETGNGLPEVELMLPLCNELGIMVNELLSGERLEDEHVGIKADENIISILSSQRKGKKKLIMAYLVGFITLLPTYIMIMVASFVDLEEWVRITLLAASLVILFVGIFISADLDRESSAYHCPHCDGDFVPDFKAYINAMHSIRYRYLKCPKCGEKHWCKRVLIKVKSTENDEK